MLRSSQRKIYLVDIVVLIQGKTDLYKILIPCVTPWVNCFYLTVTLKVKVSKRAMAVIMKTKECIELG